MRSPLRRGPAKSRVEADLPSLQVGGPSRGGDVVLRHELVARPSARSPSCADTRSNAVEAASPACRAAWPGRAGSSLARTINSMLCSPRDAVGDVEPERRVAAAVAADDLAVDPDDCVVIHRAEVQMQAVARRDIRQRKAAPIPARTEESSVADAARRGFGRERDDDFLFPLDVAGHAPDRVGVERELPRSVQRCPVVADELRPRITAAGVVQQGGRIVAA